MDSIRFGPSGNSIEFYEQGYLHTTQAPQWLAQQGLTAYEYSFGRGINLSDDTALSIGRQAQEHGVQVSVHAPYYVNFANTQDENIDKSINYILTSARKLVKLGGNRVVFHASTVGKLDRSHAVTLTRERLLKLTEAIYNEGLDNLYFCPETMGKFNQIGSLEEVVDFCKIDKIYIPTIDFGHLYARTLGAVNNEQDYKDILDYISAELGEDKCSKLHIHFSKIEYGKSGEIRHLTLDNVQFGPDFTPLAKLLAQRKLSPVVISESAGTQSQDARTMMRIYQEYIH
ncbi:MAG: TIM barrel protein, partial [Clostridia bacterium]|nr:TIM barrel protein [Clostridia bacterium]